MSRSNKRNGRAPIARLLPTTTNGNYMNRNALMKRFFPNGMPSRQEGKMGYILAWLLGVPIPVLFLIFLLRGCD